VVPLGGKAVAELPVDDERRWDAEFLGELTHGQAESLSLAGEGLGNDQHAGGYRRECSVTAEAVHAAMTVST